MERIPEDVKKGIRKMTSERLFCKLVGAGMSEEEVEGLDKTARMERWAQMVAEGADQKGPGKVRADLPVVNVDWEREKLQLTVAMEREKLEFERQKLEREEAKLEFERQKLEREGAEREKERAFELEKLTRELEFKQKVAETEEALKRKGLKLQEEQLNVQARKDSDRAARVKRYGDAMRNSLSKMGENSPIEFLQFVANLQRVYTNLDVPAELQVELMMPYLSEQCRTLLSRLHGSDVTSFDYVKQYLVEQLRLVPSYFVDEFNRLQKQKDETYKSYIARLSLLLTHYLESRKIRDMDTLTQLILCDRVKATLSPAALTHLLRCESTLTNQWADTKQIADILDTFASLHTSDGRPIASALGAVVQRREGQLGNGEKGQSGMGTRMAAEKSSPGGVMNVSRASRSSDLADLTCFRCLRRGHKRAQCPENKENKAGAGQPRRPVAHTTNARVSRCAVFTNSRFASVGSEAAGGPTRVSSSLQNAELKHEIGSAAAAAGGDVSEKAVVCEKVAVADVSGSGNVAANVRLVKGSGGPLDICVDGTQSERACNTTHINDHVAVKLAELNYVDVCVMGIKESFKSLVDAGSQINCVHPKVCDALKLTPVGRIFIKGIFGEAAPAGLYKIQVALNSPESGVRDVDDYLTIVCASCPDLNEMLVLTLPAYEQLCHVTSNRGNDVSKTMSAAEFTGTTMAVTTRSQARAAETDGGQGRSTVSPCAVARDGNEQPPVGGNCDSPSFLDVDDVASVQREFGKGSCAAIQNEQMADRSLEQAFQLAKESRAGYVIKDGLLYHREKLGDRDLLNLVVPTARRLDVLKLAHNSCHFAGKRTYERIILSGLTWRATKDSKSSVRRDANEYAANCDVCQKHARLTCYDRVPIKVVPRELVAFRHMTMDVFGEILPGEKVKYNYALLVVCSASRYPFAYPLKSPTSKNICDCLLRMFEITGIPSEMVLVSDNASYNKSKLMEQFVKVLGITPRLSTPYHPEGHALAERTIQTLQQTVIKLAGQYRNSWTAYLGPALWSIRECKNSSTHLPPFTLVYGHLPNGPLSILRESWTGERELPHDLNINAAKYLTELRERLEAASEYASQCCIAEQNKYVRCYNKRSREKQFQVGELCLILQKDGNTSWAAWKGPAVIKEIKSPHSYVVEYGGSQYHLHANKLRKFHTGVVATAECNTTLYATTETSDVVCSSNCATIQDADSDFGQVITVDPDVFTQPVVLPSQRIAPDALSHLNVVQRKQFLEILDRYPEVFSDTPGFCNAVQHEISVTDEFQPKRLRPYKIPEAFKEEVGRQISELLRLGFIERSVSPMVSPLVCVLKPKDVNGKQAVRVCCDYRYVNKYTKTSVSTVEDIPDILQQVGSARYISKFDARSGYHQCPVKPEDRWLTAFMFDQDIYQWCRTPFGMVGSGETFIRALRQVLRPIKQCAKSYVDDMAVYSKTWEDHLLHVDAYLRTMKDSGFTLGISKCELAKPMVKFVGHLVGSGKRSVDPDKVYAAVQVLKEPVNKKQLRQIIGFFSFWREYLPNFSNIAKCLTDLTGKRIPDRIQFQERERAALAKLKQLLCEAVEKPLEIIDFAKPFSLFVDSSEYAAGACLAQPSEGQERPVAFASCKYTGAQLRWSTIEKEAYAALWALQKFRHWVVGHQTTLYSDHNPITFLTETTPKSSKLMRWALALQEFSVLFCFKSGKTNVAADCLSRNVDI